jgi:Domain of unknown function (DUF4184)
MPFTFSHPIIILPFCKKENKFFSATGLVIGSMVLDLELFYYMRKVNEQHFHSTIGLLLFGIPAGIVLSFLYHLVVRNILIEYLPLIIRKKMEGYKQFDWIVYCRSNYLRVIASLFIGGMSHLFLDAFTHDYGFFVKRVYFLQNEIFLLNRHVPVYGFLQMFLSVLGLLGIAWFISVKKSVVVDDKQVSKRRSLFWTAFIFFSISFLLIRLWVDQDHQSLIDLLIATISCGIISLFLTSLLFFQNKSFKRIIFFGQRKQG